MNTDREVFDTVTLEEVERAVGSAPQAWAFECHAISLAIVRSDLFQTARVARGFAAGVAGQHSWVVVGDDCYDPEALVLDATKWAYTKDDRTPALWRGTTQSGRYTPHGSGSIWQFGKPHSGDEEPITLDDLSSDARAFLYICGPLDTRGWASLLSSPIQGWPSREIVLTASKDKRLRQLIPIDILGMLTDENPDGLYLKETT